MANSFIYSLTDSWTSSGTSYVGIGLDVTNTASAADSKLLSLAVDSTTVFSVGVSGNITSGSITTTGAIAAGTITSTGSITSAGASFSDTLVVSGDPSISSENSLEFRIDSNNDSTAQTFSITKDTGTELLSVNEAGELKFPSDVVKIGSSAAGSDGIYQIGIGANAGSGGGNYGIGIGNNAGYSAAGTDVIAIGRNAANDLSDGSRYVVAIGNYAGYQATADFGTLVGFYAGLGASGSANAVYIGSYAGRASTGSAGNQISIGYEAGYEADGDYNIVLGYHSFRNGDGSNAIAIGKGALKDVTASYGIAIGENSGNNSSDQTISVGRYAGEDSGIGTVSVGYYAGYQSTGLENVLIGTEAGYQLDSSSTYNVLIGNDSGKNLDGSTNVSIGRMAGHTYDGSESVLLGYFAGLGAVGENNIFLGANSGLSCVGSNNIELVTDGAATSILDDYSNKLHIENTIVGDTSAKKVAIGSVGSGDVVPDATLEVKPNAASDVGLIIQGASSQSANLTEWQDSAEAVKASVDEDGVALFQKITLANLPTSDPGSAGQVWNDSGTLKISAG